MSDTPRVYIADLADYNNGELRGVWLEATDEALEAAAADFVALKGHEEWAIHDYEGFGELRLDEYESLAKVSEIAKAIEEHGLAAAAFVDHYGEWDADAFAESYCGVYESEQRYAEELFDDIYVVPDFLEGYIDYEKFARDLFMGDYRSAEAPGYSVYVFRSV